jgi:hypothetical protein
MNKRTLHTLAFLTSLQGFCQENTVKDSIPNVKEIQEVIIKSQKRKVFSDHVSYSFDEKAIKSARYAKDLVVSVSQLQLDPVSNNVSSIRGGKILILINGRESSNLQLQGIKPETVVRIDYYDVPPTRWANKADLVVNVITRNPENGYTGGASVQNATFTGFVNGSAYFTHTRGKNTFGLDYNLGFRDYDNRNYHSTYEYLLNGQKYRSDEFRKEHFGYTIQEISATYSNSKEDSYSFQAKLNLNMNHYFSRANGESEFIQGAITTQNSLLNSDNEKYINPVLDLYFNKNLGQKDEIALNAVGSFFRTQNSKLAKEWVTNTGASVFENDMNLSNRQFNSVVELAHIHKFKIGKLNSGYRFSNENISNNLTNLAGHSEYEVNYFKQYFYTEFSVKIKKLMYRLGAGITNINNKSQYERTNEWSFTPNLILGYQLSKNQSLQLISSYKPNTPSGEQLSSNIVQLVPNIVKQGNPYLKPEYLWKNQLKYSFNNKYFDFNIIAFYNNTKSAITEYYSFDLPANRYVLSYENADNYTKGGAQFVGVIKPFGNNYLRITTLLAPIWEKIKIKDIEIKNSYLSNRLTLVSQYKNFTLQYQFNIPVFSLDGAFLYTNENQNHLFLQYRKNGWTFTSGMYWMGVPSEYKSKSYSKSLVEFTNHTKIQNNKNMLVFGVAYDFSKGKNNEIDKKLENSGGSVVNF